jgi:hypothetical protein
MWQYLVYPAIYLSALMTSLSLSSFPEKMAKKMQKKKLEKGTWMSGLVVG